MQLAPHCAPAAPCRAALPRRRRAAAVVAAAGVQRSTHTTPDGVRLEVLRAAPAAGAPQRPPLLFVHGSYHAAWCWAEHYLPYFASRGHDAYALSLRGQGGSDGPPGGGAVAGTLETHAADVASFAAALPAPVLVGHSFGGLIAQQVVSPRAAAAHGRPALSGVALLCSVPPGGNSAMASRMLRATPLRALRVTYAFISRGFVSDARLCRDTFFSAALPQAELLRYQGLIAGSGETRLLDLRALGASLPVPPQAASAEVPLLVLGAAEDAVVDQEGVRETAVICGAQQCVMLPGIAHDVMLDARWEDAAAALAGWLDSLLPLSA